MNKEMLAVVTCSLLLLSGMCAQAIPTSWTEAIELVAAPASLVEGELESSTDIRLIWEQQDLVLTDDLLVNLSQPGSYDRYTFNSTPAVISAGTRVSSYLLHFDPIDFTLATLSGSVTFNSPILGVIVQNPALNASDPILGAPGTTYPGWSPLSGSDLLWLTLTMDSISVSLAADYQVDQVRIITRVPDFSNTALLMGYALLGLGGTRRLLRKRRSC